MAELNENEKIEKILEYWYTLDFLNQGKFPDGMSEKRAINKVLEPDGKKRKSLQGFVEGTIDLENGSADWILAHKHNRKSLNLDETIKSIANKQAQICGMTAAGTFDVYVGTVQRDKIIERLTKKLNMDGKDRFPELSEDEIALCAFQLTSNGGYDRGNFLLSPILWATEEARPGCKASETFVKENYEICCKDIEEESGLSKTPNDDYTVKVSDIADLYSYIRKSYLSDDDFDAKEPLKIAIEYRMYADEKSGEETDSDSFRGLCSGFYLDDLDILIKENKKHGLKPLLKKYVLALHEGKAFIPEGKRKDLVKCNSEIEDCEERLDEFQLLLNDILRMKNAPLGKWPSKYSPALMQQLAINLTVSDEFDKELGENGKVFSVNGPPGTGKTTLLKEIVANNIVERARLLAEYNKPADAFETMDFKKGNATENGNFYSTYVRHWHKLKNDHINDYSMLVASCNNAAVENISKELPESKSVRFNIDKEHELSDVENGMLEVDKLFDSNDEECEEETYACLGDDGKMHSYDASDIYFTEYAKNLLSKGDKENKGDAWGLISIPLGKKNNIYKFFDSALKGLLKNFMMKGDLDNLRISKYEEARKRFNAQYDKVLKLRDELDSYGKIVEDAIEHKRGLRSKIAECKRTQERCGTDFDGLRERLQELNARKASIDIKIQPFEKDVRFKEEKHFKQKEKVENARSEHINVNSDIVKAQNSVGFFAKIFKTAKYRNVMALIEAYRGKANSVNEEFERLNAELEEMTQALDAARATLKPIAEKRDKNKGEIAAIDAEMKKCANEMDVAASEINDAESELAAVENAMKNKLCELENAQGEGKAAVFDRQFVEELLSDNENISAKRHVQNPWTTEYFNREREKLFFYAIKLNKEFVLSSKACRDNLETLVHYWGYKLSKDAENMPKFDEEASDGCVTALYQTLFLLTPVISSTFASIQRLFKDVVKENAFGMLIVDEAGQAEPHMAVGALYRCRNALIVGDPKQVEPVVTDDLKLIRDSYTEDLYIPYKNKKASVQSCADILNPYGTYLGSDDSGDREWVGCPLLVHRRCVSPMFDISNAISYDGLMKKMTSEPDGKNFIMDKSCWISVSGTEDGSKNHFVNAQGDEVCKLLEIAFENNSSPDLYIISPFKTVVSGVKNCIENYRQREKSVNSKSTLAGIDEEVFNAWMYENIGTVHTFQGKEADEVIFLLGCDGEQSSVGAIRWVNANIVNVAVSRAKYRLYIIGDEKAWMSNSKYLEIAHKLIQKEA